MIDQVVGQLPADGKAELRREDRQDWQMVIDQFTVAAQVRDGWLNVE
ncbi:MAG: hypothetical protein ACKV2Q_06930 [Planctomycetaceae bacterium]